MQSESVFEILPGTLPRNISEFGTSAITPIVDELDDFSESVTEKYFWQW